MNTENNTAALAEINEIQQQAKDKVKVKVKEWATMTKREQNDVEFLIAQRAAYQSTFDDPSANKSYIKIENALFDAEQKAEKELKRLDKSGGDDYSSMNEAEKRQFVCTLLDPHYRKGFGRDGTKRMLKVIDAASQVVSIVDNKQAMQEQVEQTIADLVVEKGETLSPYLIAELAKYWNLYGEAIPESLVTYGGLTDDKWVLGRSKHKPLAGPMPTWNNFMKRMNDPKAFAAWIYGVASQRYRGRQVLWMHGAEGEDGKTFIQKIIANEIFPNVTAAMSNHALSEGAARFMQADFEGKVLATWGDCNNAAVLLREDIKQLSAGAEGDVARVEKKNKQAYSAQMEAVLWINSNFRPIVTGDNFVRSRLLYINLEKLEEPKDITLKAKFIAELPALLAYGEQCYTELCTDNRKVVQNNQSNESIDEMVLESEGEYESIFSRYFTVIKETARTAGSSYALVSDIPPILKKEGLKSNIAQGWWYDWLSKRHQLVRSQRVVGDKKRSVIVGLKIKDSAWKI